MYEKLVEGSTAHRFRKFNQSIRPVLTDPFKLVAHPHPDPAFLNGNFRSGFKEVFVIYRYLLITQIPSENQHREINCSSINYLAKFFLFCFCFKSVDSRIWINEKYFCIRPDPDQQCVLDNINSFEFWSTKKIFAYLYVSIFKFVKNNVFIFQLVLHEKHWERRADHTLLRSWTEPGVKYR